MARRCDGLDCMRLLVDLEQMGKSERQAGRNTFISTHTVSDIGIVKRQLRQSKLMVRLNPVHAGSLSEVNAALDEGADMLMVPMFISSTEVQHFCDLVANRAPVVALLETGGALNTLQQWISTPGLSEVYVGLNDLHVSLGMRFMFEPLAVGLLDEVARVTHAHGLRFGFGGVARVGEGLLPGEDVLAEHARLGSQAVILSRTFHNGSDTDGMNAAIARLRQEEYRLARRPPAEAEADRIRIAQVIQQVAGQTARQKVNA